MTGKGPTSGATATVSLQKRQQLREVVESAGIHACVDPSEIDYENINEVERMLASHTWSINSIDHTRSKKIQICYSCVKCGTERLAFVEWIPKA